jgi:hypothetical protein
MATGTHNEGLVCKRQNCAQDVNGAAVCEEKQGEGKKRRERVKKQINNNS